MDAGSARKFATLIAASAAFFGAGCDGAADLTDAGSTSAVQSGQVRVVYVSGSNQIGTSGSTLTDSLVIRSLDWRGRPLPGVYVEFEASSGGGSLTPRSGITNANGQFASAWTLGPSGQQIAKARAPASASPSRKNGRDTVVVFNATLTAPPTGAVGTLTVSPGAATLTGIGASVNLQAVARDGAGELVTQANVQWVSLNPGVAIVDSIGRVTSRAIGTAIIVASTVCCASDSAGIDVVARQPAAVSDLAVESVSTTSVTLRWTQVDDGAGGPASYAVRYGSPDLTWSNAAATEVSVPGTGVGSVATYTFSGLSSDTGYEFQLVSYRGTLGADAVFGPLSNQAAATTDANVTAPGPEQLLHETWANGIDRQRWSDGYRAEHHSVVSDPTGAGRGQVLRAVHTDAGGASHLAHWTHGAGQRNPTGELFLRTWIFVPSDFDGADYAKMLIIKGNRTDNLYSSYGQAGVRSNGTNFFESYVSYGAPNHANTGVHFYTYHADMPGSYGHYDYTRAAELANRRPSTGAWHKFEFWLRQNDVGQSNGAQRVWVDGRLIMEWTGLRFRTSEILQANNVAVTFSSSGNTGQVWYVDDVYVFDRLPSDMTGW